MPLLTEKGFWFAQVPLGLLEALSTLPSLASNLGTIPKAILFVYNADDGFAHHLRRCPLLAMAVYFSWAKHLKWECLECMPWLFVTINGGPHDLPDELSEDSGSDAEGIDFPSSRIARSLPQTIAEYSIFLR